MEAARVYITTPAPDDDGDSVGEACTAKQDNFAKVWAETGNQAVAYRRTYAVHDRTLPNTVWSAASRIAAIPHVRKKMEEYQRQFALETLCTVREALAWQLDIATADPNEIGFVAQRACRHCYGVGHQYQWINEEEFLAAIVQAVDDKKPTPTDAGGYGYFKGAKPSLDCPQCLGNGFEETVLKDTRELTGKARKLYKGIDYKNGRYVVLMHDQQKAWEMACRIIGAFNDKLDLTLPGGKQVAKIPDGMSEQDTARAYLAMLGS